MIERSVRLAKKENKVFVTLPFSKNPVECKKPETMKEKLRLTLILYARVLWEN